jgi:hypothetical protein
MDEATYHIRDSVDLFYYTSVNSEISVDPVVDSVVPYSIPYPVGGQTDFVTCACAFSDFFPIQ